MKKHVLHFIILLLFSCSVTAQDSLYFKNGQVESVRITEVTPTHIKYKRSSESSGTVYIISKDKLSRIVYEGGSIDDLQGNANAASGEDIPEIRHYSGPRIGMTVVFPGAFADQLASEGKRSIYSQFGWQFETRMFTLAGGYCGLVEFVPMFGGLDMGKCIPSVSLIIGMRTTEGYELGLGPNWALYGYKDQYDLMNFSQSAGIIIAAGWSFKKDNVFFPMNLAVVPSVTKTKWVTDASTQTSSPYHYKTGVKMTLVIGFNNRVR